MKKWLSLLSSTCELPADRMAYLGAISLANKPAGTWRKRKSLKGNRNDWLKTRKEASRLKGTKECHQSDKGEGVQSTAVMGSI